jgi:hypothetical protein
MVTRTCQTKRGVQMEIDSRRKTVSDRLDPFWTGSADNQVPTKTADFALALGEFPGAEGALAAVGTVSRQLVRKSWRVSCAAAKRREGSRVAYTKERDPSGIRTVPGRFDVNRGTTRTCIECEGVSGGSDRWGRSALTRPLP